MTMLYRFHIFGVNVYITTRRMKLRSAKDDLRRNRRKELMRLKHQLYMRGSGSCSCCGRFFPEADLEVHHVVSLGERPDLVSRKSNLRLLCRECHGRVHEL